ncbi:MAG: hypothetical protein ACYSU7_11705 [Planctomycetota bacterium]|jgi:hypothetical protein
MISKPKTIEAIQQLNRSAKRDWLDTFATCSLRRYLNRLELTLGPRGRQSTWIRHDATPAVVTRAPGP